MGDAAKPVIRVEGLDGMVKLWCRHVEEPAVSSSGRNHNLPRRPNPAGGRNEAQDLVDQGRACRGAGLTAQDVEHQLTPVRATTIVEPGVSFTTLVVPCVTPALRNVRLPKDFKGPRKVPNYTANLHPESWVESYEMAMEILDVDGAVCAKYFTMMLEGTTRTWLKSLPPNSIGSWEELKSRFINNFKDICKQPMSIVDLAACVEAEGESTTHWVCRVYEILHSSDRINADSAIITLEVNCKFKPLKIKLGRMERHCNDMGTLMGALLKYADYDDTRDPVFDKEKPGKGKKSGNTKGQQPNPAGNGNNGK